MKVAIIGAGFGGLSAAYFLSKAGADVTVFESSDTPGGLAGGFLNKGWEWSLEHHYHHFFTNDDSVLGLAKEVGQNIIIASPKSSTYFSDGVYQFDSPSTLLKFSKLSIFDRLRTGAVMALLKAYPFWKPLEKTLSEKFIRSLMGKNSWKFIWEPLFVKKFGKYSSDINAAWFWARIYKRTMKLAYPEGGFLSLARKIENEIIKNGGRVLYNNLVTNLSLLTSVQQRNSHSGLTRILLTASEKTYTFDKVICTIPTDKFIEITNGLPKNYTNKYMELKSLGAINLVISLKKGFLPGNTYWLNVNDLDYPFVSIVEHTNFMSASHYNNEHLLYIGNYLPHNHKYFSYDANRLLKEFTPYLKKINNKFSAKMIKKVWVFKDKYAQPVVLKNHSKNIPKFTTPISGLYLCNMQQVYPWDRGTNYAVENGKKLAQLILNG